MSKEIDMHKAAMSLCESKPFLDLMRGLYDITGFNSYMRDGASPDALNKANGKREVWGQLRQAMNLPQEVITKIEHFKLMKDD